MLLVESSRQHRRLVARIPSRVQDGDRRSVHQIWPAATTRSTRRPEGRSSRPTRPRRRCPGRSPSCRARARSGWRTPAAARSIVAGDGKNLSVVNTVALEAYVRGVVSNEMPHDWPLEAVKAQAVAARSYALAHRRGGAFDVYADTRDQVYGGITTETPVGDQAVAGDQAPGADSTTARSRRRSSSRARAGGLRRSPTCSPSAKPTSRTSSRSPTRTTRRRRTTPGGRWRSRRRPPARLLGVPGLTRASPGARHGPARDRRRDRPRRRRARCAGGDIRRALGLRSTWIRVGVLLALTPGRHRRRRHAA